MRSIGIDIGSSSIKIVEVTQNKKGVLVSRFFQQPLTLTPGHDTNLEVLEFLRTLGRGQDKNTVMVVALSQDQASVRTKFFPFHEKLKLLKSLPFELEEELPYASDQAIFDAKIVRYVGQGAEVLACSSPKSNIKKTLSRALDAGVDVNIVSLEGLAYANCFEAWDQAPVAMPAPPPDLDEASLPKRKLHIRIHIGHEHSLVCAFEQNRMVSVRTILWGGKQVAEGIARRYELPFIEALKEMQTKAFILPSREGAAYDQIVFSDTISAQVRDLGKELKVTIMEFQSELGAIVESASLSGGTSGILNINSLLTQILEVPVNKEDTLSRFSQVAFERTPQVDSVIGVALGLALEGLKRPRNPAVNFRKEEFLRKNQVLREFWNKWGLVFKFSAAAFFIFFLFSVTRDQLSITLSDQADEALKTQAKNLPGFPTGKSLTEKSIKTTVKRKIEYINSVKAVSDFVNQDSALAILKKISDGMPGKEALAINVQELNISGDTVDIRGYLTPAGSLPLLVTALKQISEKGKIETTAKEITDAKGRLSFSYRLSVNRNNPSRVRE